jgi:AcrR family transcriptional regulator
MEYPNNPPVMANSGRIGTRERILTAAAESFCVKGFQRTSIREIADAAGLNEGTIFRYFPQKQELFWPAIDWYFRSSGFADVFQAALCRGGPTRELLIRFSQEMQRFLGDNAGIIRMLYFAALELNTEKRVLYSIHLKPLWNALLTRIRIWMHEGSLPAGDPALIALLIAAGILPACEMKMWFDLSPEGSEQSAHIEQLIDFLVSGASLSAHLEPGG